ncbi:hypothetical protein HOY82DRAFT_92451 [Tuber indicum]|nr:hypothetical protein HOY82DRAFT_92451 [Tuber indicum]
MLYLLPCSHLLQLCILKFSSPLPLAVFFLRPPLPPQSVLWLADRQTDSPYPVLWKGRKSPNAPPTCIILIPSPLQFTPDRSGTERNRYCQPTLPSVLPDSQAGQQDIACPFWPGPQGQPASQHAICPYMQPANNVRPSIVSFKSYSTVARLAVSYPIEGEKTGTPTIPYLPACLVLVPTLPQIHTGIKGSKNKEQKREKEKKKVKNKNKKTQKELFQLHAHTHPNTLTHTTSYFIHSLTTARAHHVSACLSYYSSRVDNRSPPHPRPLLAVTCLLLSSP